MHSQQQLSILKYIKPDHQCVSSPRRDPRPTGLIKKSSLGSVGDLTLQANARQTVQSVSDCRASMFVCARVIAILAIKYRLPIWRQTAYTNVAHTLGRYCFLTQLVLHIAFAPSTAWLVASSTLPIIDSTDALDGLSCPQADISLIPCQIILLLMPDIIYCDAGGTWNHMIKVCCCKCVCQLMNLQSHLIVQQHCAILKYSAPLNELASANKGSHST